jgi:hypothetical protein
MADATCFETIPEQVGFPSPPPDGLPRSDVRSAKRGHVTNLPCLNEE